MSQTETPQNQDSQDKVIDDPVRNLLTQINQEDVITEYGNSGKQQDTEKLEIAKILFPEKEEWAGKTKINSQYQALIHTRVRMLPKLYPEVYGDLEKEINDFVDYYEQYLTSVEGYAREQQVSIIRSFFSKVSDSVEETRDMFRSFMIGSQNEGDKNED